LQWSGKKKQYKKMKDYHIHIGQFNDFYYNPTDILRIVAETGVAGCYYSSTSSCNAGVKLRAVEQEIIDCTKQFSPDEMQPLLWFMPDYINQGVTVEKAFANVPYRGIKLHPRFNRWDLNDSKQLDCLHSLFGFAHDNRLQITIHTGEDDFERPCFFEQFFDKYKNASITLAHCRPLDDAIAMFKKYPNLKGDTAFVSKENIQTLINSGFKERLLIGSDFPITHYFCTKQGKKDISPEEQYREDVLNIRLLLSEP
jgi:predicted TIM-barrel fold metal-dependent hydrolase